MNFDIDKIEGFIEQNEKNSGYIIHPREHITSGGSFDLPYAVRYLQIRMRAALFFFLNGTYWLEDNFSKVDMIYPFFSKVEPFVKNILLDLIPALDKISTNLGVFKGFRSSLNVLNKCHVSSYETASIFGSFYREFEYITSQLDTVEVIEKKGRGTVKTSTYPSKDRNYLAPLFELQIYSRKYFDEFLKGFYLHGSLATDDYIRHWSDLDTLMIVRKETIMNPKYLVELRKRTIQSHLYLYQLDPHQLHGHLLVSELDLNYYPLTFFPLVLFDYSKSFFNENIAIKFTLRECESERIATFWNDSVKYFMLKAVQFSRRRRKLMLSNERKLFFHRLLTFPLFYLQARGINVYKKYSFDKAKPDFPDKDWEVIRGVTSIMKNWEYCYRANRNMKIVGNFNIKLYLLLINKYYDMKYPFIGGAFNSFNRNYGKWLLSALDLSTTGWNNVLKSNKLA